MKKRVAQKKRFSGVVVSSKMDKTVVVSLERSRMHPLYEKRYYFDKKLKVHNPENKAMEGDRVEIIETRPMSKSKKYIINKIIDDSSRN
jgi:small subunit ribosomal protein S17